MPWARIRNAQSAASIATAGSPSLAVALLAVARRSISLAQGRLLTGELALQCVAEIPLSSVVIHAGKSGVDPHNLITWAHRVRRRRVGWGLCIGAHPCQKPKGEEGTRKHRPPEHETSLR